MKQLTKEQIDLLNKELSERGLIDQQTKVEFLDHIACLIEVKMQDGKTFQIALEEIISTFSKEDLIELSKATSSMINMKEVTKNIIIKNGLYTGIALCIWIFIEYITGRWFGIPELGAFYGLLSMVILGVAISKNVQQIIRKTEVIRTSFLTIFKSGMKVVFISSLVVLVFLLFYIGFLNTELYGIYEVTDNVDRDLLSISIIVSMWLGVLLEGSILVTVIGLFSNKKPSH